MKFILTPKGLKMLTELYIILAVYLFIDVMS